MRREGWLNIGGPLSVDKVMAAIKKLPWHVYVPRDWPQFEDDDQSLWARSWRKWKESNRDN